MALKIILLFNLIIKTYLLKKFKLGHFWKQIELIQTQKIKSHKPLS